MVGEVLFKELKFAVSHAQAVFSKYLDQNNNNKKNVTDAIGYSSELSPATLELPNLGRKARQ